MKYNRKSIRLKGYDYSSEGMYFVTMCAKNRDNLFGSIINGEVVLSECGKIAFDNWMEIPKHFSNIFLDEYIIMADHIHGIIIINNNIKNTGGAEYIQPEVECIRPQRKNDIPTIISAYKASVTREINKDYNNIHFEWQRNYYEHIIRNENELNRIRKYIINNPIKWELKYKK